MKNVLFYIATEFHYLAALSMVDKFYPESEYKIHFLVQLNPHRPNRLDNVKFIPKHEIIKLSFDHNRGDVYPDVLNAMKLIQQTKFEHFISFLFHDPMFVYLTYYFRKVGTKNFLAPDGMGAYVKFTKLTLRSRWVNTSNAYKFFKRHQLTFPKLWFTSWNFGENGYIDTIYAFSPELPYLRRNIEIKEVDYTLKPERIEQLKHVFSVDFNNIPLENVVLLINERHNNEAYETKLVEMVKANMPKFHIIFKKHPNQSAESLKFLEKYDGITVMDKVFPVELLIASLKDSFLISSYSNSMIYNNPTCRVFWMYPVLEKMGILRKPITRHNPKKHIKVIQSMEELGVEMSTFQKLHTADVLA